MANTPITDCREYVFADDLEAKTGIPASTWRYWASVNEGPASFMLGRRRVWKLSDVEAWLALKAAKAGV